VSRDRALVVGEAEERVLWAPIILSSGKRKAFARTNRLSVCIDYVNGRLSTDSVKEIVTYLVLRTGVAVNRQFVSTN
jgi:hypothetical protein